MNTQEPYEYELTLTVRVPLTLRTSHPALAETAAWRSGIEMCKTIEEALPGVKAIPNKLNAMRAYDAPQTALAAVKR